MKHVKLTVTAVDEFSDLIAKVRQQPKIVMMAMVEASYLMAKVRCSLRWP